MRLVFSECLLEEGIYWKYFVPLKQKQEDFQKSGKRLYHRN